MFFKSDWHIHSVASYDAKLKVATLLEQSAAQGVTDLGLTDHVNIPSWIHFLEASAALVKQYKRPGFHFGIELTTISGYLEAYDRKYGSRDGYEHPGTPGVDPIAFPLTAEEMDAVGVEYVIGAGHWLLNAPREQDAVIKELHRQHLFCAASPLVDIVGHPYCMFGTFKDHYGREVGFDDFSIVPRSMNEELIAAIKENGKCMEANVSFFGGGYPEPFRRSYAAFVREAFEAGVPITIGTDCHGPEYNDVQDVYAKYLGDVGFKTEDFAMPKFGKRKKA